MLAVSLVSSYTDSLLRGVSRIGAGERGACKEPWPQDLLTESRADLF